MLRTTTICAKAVVIPAQTEQLVSVKTQGVKGTLALVKPIAGNVGSDFWVCPGIFDGTLENITVMNLSQKPVLCRKGKIMAHFEELQGHAYDYHTVVESVDQDTKDQSPNKRQKCDMACATQGVVCTCRRESAKRTAWLVRPRWLAHAEGILFFNGSNYFSLKV